AGWVRPRFPSTDSCFMYRALKQRCRLLSSTVAVQCKRYEPSKPITREMVALFQRDAQTKGAERAIMVTLSRYTKPAREAARATTPTVDLIDGERLCDLALEKEFGVRMAPLIDDSWFETFAT
ncbi:MAG TPA: restriction endonuclease, partial [Acidimicrobiia bacterium]|nr:restriction endonuclease [Acidimicrobiia bacterium]